MKINGINPDANALDKLSKPQGGAKSAFAAGVAKAAEESAVAKLSGKSGELSAPEAPFDAARVAEIKDAIQRGEFRVNADAVAAKVIESARELLGQK